MGESWWGELDVALNESDVVGIQERSGSIVLLLHVFSVPEYGPVDPDTRRMLVLSEPSRVQVLLRRDRLGADAYGPVVPLPDLQSVDEFLASLSWSGSMYGWRFLDAPELIDDWPDLLSLDLGLASTPARHSLYWFNECGREEDGDQVAYCIEGVVEFERLRVLRADGTSVALEDFVADGKRWWSGLHTGDPRVGIEAQKAQAKSPSWRPVPHDATPPESNTR
ncbi:hypothetical protein AB0C29_14830 [Actinoplanes sp. NPDC048791]|uniref:hypothetical protein n=1 Tax=Actinoplanes sp. NPDC048791 TaxID=3154623 RepID=UPI0033C00E40